MERAARLGVSPSWHINHIHYYGEALADEILGPDRAQRLMPMAAAAKAGLAGSLHNDSPMYPAEPFKLMATAVTRKTRNGRTIGPDQAVTPEEAFRALTINAARHMDMDDIIGSLVPGKKADLAVLSDNPLATDPDRLIKISVLNTYRGGRPAAV